MTTSLAHQLAEKMDQATCAEIRGAGFKALHHWHEAAQLIECMVKAQAQTPEPSEPPAAHICQSAEFKAGGVVCPACRAAGVQDHICTEECERAMSAAADALAQEAQQMGLYALRPSEEASFHKALRRSATVVATGIPFRHWSKDCAVPYEGCHCNSCEEARAEDARAAEKSAQAADDLVAEAQQMGLYEPGAQRGCTCGGSFSADGIYFHAPGCMGVAL